VIVDLLPLVKTETALERTSNVGMAEAIVANATAQEMTVFVKSILAVLRREIYSLSVK
jgi:hypothetical protein